MRIRASLRKLDWFLIAAASALLAIGLLVLLEINFRDIELAASFEPLRQVESAVLGIIALIVMMRIDYRIWLKLGKYWYLIGIGLLLIVRAFGTPVAGSVRSISIGFLQFQPAEFMKIGIILALATLFVRRQKQMASWRYLLLSLLVVGIPTVLIALQPDLGSAVTVIFIWGLMILTSAASKWKLALLIVLAAVIAPLGYSHLHDYQKDRLASFFNPEADPQGSGYNAVQATIAVGSGGLFGKGLGAGSQSRLNFLPSQQTDFIFAVTAEKLGFVGASLVVLLFILLIVRALRVSWHPPDYFAFALAIGIAAMFFAHVVINIGMNLGLLPVTGIPLPFLSYGGSNLIVSLAAIGLLESIRLHQSGLEFKT